MANSTVTCQRRGRSQTHGPRFQFGENYAGLEGVSVLISHVTEDVAFVPFERKVFGRLQLLHHRQTVLDGRDLFPETSSSPDAVILKRLVKHSEELRPALEAQENVDQAMSVRQRKPPHQRLKRLMVGTGSVHSVVDIANKTRRETIPVRNLAEEIMKREESTFTESHDPSTKSSRADAPRSPGVSSRDATGQQFKHIFPSHIWTSACAHLKRMESFKTTDYNDDIDEQ